MTINKKTQICTMCGYEKDIDAFYNSHSILFKKNINHKMTICKECVTNVYSYFLDKMNIDVNAIYLTCQILDAYFSISTFEAAKKQALKNNSNIAAIYFQKINSLKQCKNKSFLDSDKFDIDGARVSKEVNKEFQNAINNKFEVTSEMIAFWGSGLSREDLFYLENDYHNLKTYSGCDSYSQQILLKQISHQNLDIKKKRENGENVDKELKTLQDLLGSAGLKHDKTNSLTAGNQAALGTLIDKWEAEKPIPKPSKEFMDVDGIKRYITVWFFGHLCKMLGVNNDAAKMYEEELVKYTVQNPNDEGEEDE